MRARLVLLYPPMEESMFLKLVKNNTYQIGTDAIILIVLATLALLFLIGMILSFCLSFKKDKVHKESLDQPSSSILIFRVNMESKRVIYFSKATLNPPAEITLDEFYAKFKDSDRGAIMSWIDEFISEKGTHEYLQTSYLSMMSKNPKKPLYIPAFLRCTSYDKDKHYLHLETYLLGYYAESMKKSGGIVFSNSDEFNESIRMNGHQSGCTFCFSMTPITSKGGILTEAQMKDKITPEAITKFRSVVSSYCVGNQKLIKQSPNELVIANFDMIDSSQAISFALQVANDCKDSLSSIKRRRVAYEVRVGIVFNKDLEDRPEDILEAARQLSKKANETQTLLSFFKRGEDDAIHANDLSQQQFRDEVGKIIYDGRLSFAYRPVYNSDSGRIIGYLGRSTPRESAFNDIDELKNYAFRSDQANNLFAAIAKGMIPKFVNERTGVTFKLFYPMRVKELDFAENFFGSYKYTKKMASKDASDRDNTAQLCLLFKEYEISKEITPDKMEGFVKDITRLKNRGFQIAFLLSGHNLLLSDLYYSLCDYFFVDFSFSGSAGNMNQKVRSELHALVERILKFKKPIIANSLMSWPSLELVIRSGIPIFSSDIFAGYDPMIKPINEKALKRLQDMKGKD